MPKWDYRNFVVDTLNEYAVDNLGYDDSAGYPWLESSRSPASPKGYRVIVDGIEGHPDKAEIDSKLQWWRDLLDKHGFEDVDVKLGPWATPLKDVAFRNIYFIVPYSSDEPTEYHLVDAKTRKTQSMRRRRIAAVSIDSLVDQIVTHAEQEGWDFEDEMHVEGYARSLLVNMHEIEVITLLREIDPRVLADVSGDQVFTHTKPLTMDDAFVSIVTYMLASFAFEYLM